MESLIGIGDILIVASLVMAIIPTLNPQITFRLKVRGYKKFVILLVMTVLIVVLSTVIQHYSLYCLGCPIVWSLVAFILFLVTFVWFVCSAYKPVLYSPKNAEHFFTGIRNLCERGKDDELLCEVAPSIKLLVKNAEAQKPERFGCLTLLILADDRICNRLVISHYYSAFAVMDAYRDVIGFINEQPFLKNIIRCAIMNPNSFHRRSIMKYYQGDLTEFVREKSFIIAMNSALQFSHRDYEQFDKDTLNCYEELLLESFKTEHICPEMVIQYGFILEKLSSVYERFLKQGTFFWLRTHVEIIKAISTYMKRNDQFSNNVYYGAHKFELLSSQLFDLFYMLDRNCDDFSLRSKVDDLLEILLIENPPRKSIERTFQLDCIADLNEHFKLGRRYATRSLFRCVMLMGGLGKDNKCTVIRYFRRLMKRKWHNCFVQNQEIMKALLPQSVSYDSQTRKFTQVLALGTYTFDFE
ncbi:MAG: hypothetical protein IKB43_01310 [Fibrobacter sp.]|nr:hypothetical protein [Fibrobacter sp.]